MKARKKGSNLVIELSMQAPKRSASGKTLVVATSRGAWESPVEVNGKAVKIIVNAYIDPTESPAKTEIGEEMETVPSRKANSRKAVQGKETRRLNAWSRNEKEK